MEKIYDCALAKKRLHGDRFRINGKSAYTKTYDQVVEAYHKRYGEYPPLKKKAFVRGKPDEPPGPKRKAKTSGVPRPKNKTKPKKTTPLTKDQEWWADYQKYIHSALWYAFRRMIMAKYNYTCQKCFLRFKTGNLNVHHLHYRNFKNEKEEDVLLVCTECHNEIHREKNREKKALQQTNKLKP